MNKFDRIIVVIPALNPDENLIETVAALKSNICFFSNIIVVDDGSRSESQKIFKRLEDDFQVKILIHSINLGQGRAYKTAMNYCLRKYPDMLGILQCDADGQHHIEDIVKCAQLFEENPNSLILGVRDFDSGNVPFRSRFGNKCTSFIFKFFCDLDIKDTQSGLKGIPVSLLPALMEIPGERYEYASSVLLETRKRGVPIIQFDIKTIYINDNESSHFNPIIDSIRIYSLILKYMLSSLSSFIIDIVIFTVGISIFADITFGYYIIVATYIAKVFSCAYSFCINKNLVFQCKKQKSVFIKYIYLCVIQATISALATTAVAKGLHCNEILGKILVDTVMFFASFQIQRKWVFK